MSEAIREYHAALHLEPKALPARVNLGLAYYRLSLWREAAKAFDEVLEVSPEDRRSRELLAISLTHCGEYSRAASAYEKLMPSNQPEVLVGLVSCYKELGRVKESEQVLASLLGQGESATTEYLLGMAAYVRKDYTQSITDLRQSLRLSPGAPEVHFYLGAAYFKLRRLDEALAEWKEAGQLDANYFPSIFACGALLVDEHAAADAVPFLEHAYSLRPNEPNVQAALGKAYLLTDAPDKALPLLRSARQLDPQSQSTSFLLAGSLKQLGRRAEAAAEYERCKHLAKADMNTLSEPSDLTQEGRQ